MTEQDRSSRVDFDLPNIRAGNAGSGASQCCATAARSARTRPGVIQYRADNLRIVPVFGPAALSVTPRIGHIASWHWVDASGEPLIIQGLTPGPHRD